ncbi:MAG: hypothetical protein ACEQSH_00885 [Bacteroidia bacterium]
MTGRYAVAFTIAPEIGTTIDLDGMPYTLVKRAAHVRTDGTPTTLLTWRFACATCGASSTVRTGLKCKAVNRRCENHKAVGVPATRAARKRRALALVAKKARRAHAQF